MQTRNLSFITLPLFTAMVLLGARCAAQKTPQKGTVAPASTVNDTTPQAGTGTQTTTTGNIGSGNIGSGNVGASNGNVGTSNGNVGVSNGNVGTGAGGTIAAGTGIGTAPDVSAFTITGQTMQACNSTGKVWVPQISSGSITGTCEEDLAAITCDTTHIEAYFNSLGFDAQYNSFITANPGYSLYNCGLKDGMLILHWLKTDKGMSYGTMSVSYP